MKFFLQVTHRLKDDREKCHQMSHKNRLVKKCLKLFERLLTNQITIISMMMITSGFGRRSPLRLDFILSHCHYKGVLDQECGKDRSDSHLLFICFYFV